MRPWARPCTRRRLLQGGLAWAGLGLAAGCGVPQPPAPTPARTVRIGVLTHSGIGSLPEGEALRQGLRDLGWGAGERTRIDYRFAGAPEAVAEAVAELLGLAPDVILADGNALVQALRSATGTTPIVMTNGRDPVESGLVASLGRPGGNVTGLANLGAELTGKRLGLIKEILPGATRVVIAWQADYEGAIDEGRLRAAAEQLGLQAHFGPFRNRRELEAAVAARADALLLLSDFTRPTFPTIFAGLAVQARMPSVVGSGGLVREGAALLGYGPNVPGQFRRAATYVDKILRGAKPADLPVEQPREFDFVINLKTAQAIGLTIPESVLQQATEVIQ